MIREKDLCSTLQKYQDCTFATLLKAQSCNSAHYIINPDKSVLSIELLHFILSLGVRANAS